MKRLFVVCFLTSLLPATVYGQVRDRVSRRSDKKTVSGEITSVTPDFVTIDSQKISVSDIDRWWFRDDPSGISAVRAAYRNGQLEQALQEVDSVTPTGREFVQQEVAFYKAVIPAKLALRGASDVKAAARDVGTFLKQHSNSFRYYDACEVMGDLAMSLGRSEVASVYYGKLTKSKSEAVSARGALLLGDALVLSGDVDRAREMYIRCEQADDTRLQAMGQLAVATCTAPSDPAAAIRKIEKVIAENDSEDIELFARAYNALGSAFVTAGKTESALDAYLHTDLLFYRDAEKHAEALYHLSKLWAEVNKPSEASKARNTLKTTIQVQYLGATIVVPTGAMGHWVLTSLYRGETE